MDVAAGPGDRASKRGANVARTVGNSWLFSLSVGNYLITPRAGQPRHLFPLISLYGGCDMAGAAESEKRPIWSYGLALFARFSTSLSIFSNSGRKESGLRTWTTRSSETVE